MSAEVVAQKNTKGIMAVAGCTIIMAVNVGYQVVMTAFPSVIKGLAITKLEASFMVTVLTLAVLITALLGTKLIDYLTPKWSMLIGTLLCVVFLVINSFVTNYTLFVISGAIAGVGSALGTLASAAGIMRQFWGNKAGKLFGVVTGLQTLIVAGYIALVGILLSIMDYRQAFLVIAAIVFVLGVGANLILIRKPDEDVRKANEDEANKAKAAKAEQSKNAEGWTLGQSFKHATLYFYVIGVIVAAVISGGFTTFATTFLVDNGVNQSVAAYYLSFFTIICGVHMLYSGYFQAKFGTRAFFIFFYAGVIVGFGVLTMWIGIKTLPVAIVALTLIGFIKPIMTTAAIVSTDLFGNRDYVAYNSFTQAMFNAGKMIATFTTALILQYLGGVFMAYFFAGLSAIAGASFVVSHKLSPWAVKKASKKEAGNEVAESYLD